MEKADFWRNFKIGAIRGIGGTFGATIGFAIVSTIIIFALNKAGGLPLIGDWIANIVRHTEIALKKN